jgi:hypothetical protein
MADEEREVVLLLNKALFQTSAAKQMKTALF